MKLQRRPFLPTPPPGISDPVIRDYLSQLHLALERVVQDIHTDFAQGHATLTEFSADPSASDLDENQMAVRSDAGNEALYINVGGTVKKAILT